ncbi:MAG: bifunctional riboflavin kinase/FAD synthetase, partial [Acidimicrobiales bacterium]
MRDPDLRGSGDGGGSGAGSVVSIGAYDGVHLGHRVLLARVVAMAGELGLGSAVVTFDRHPATVVRPESAPALLTDLDQ